MAKASGTQSKAFRRARLWFASIVAVSLGAVAATFVMETNVGQSLELEVSDVLRAANPLPDEAADSQFLTIEIDDAALERGGRWPWSRPMQAELIDALSSLGPRMIVLDIEYSEAEKASVEEVAKADGTQDYVMVRDPDERFRASIVRAGNVLVPFSLYFKDRAEGHDLTAAEATGLVGLPAVLRRHTLPLAAEDAPGVLQAEAYSAMIPPLGDAAAGSGFTSILKDVDNTVRRIPLVARGGNLLFPHMALEIAGQSRFGPDYRVGMDKGWLVLSSADGSESVSVAVDSQAQLNLRWPRSLGAMERISARALLAIRDARLRLAPLRQRLPAVLADLDALWPEAGWADARRAAADAAAQAEANPASGSLAEQVRQLETQARQVEGRLVMNLMEYDGKDPDKQTDPAERSRAEAARKHLDFLRNLSAAEGNLDEAVEAVRPRVEGRACILGLNATAVTDQHKTPISNSQPGVTAYDIAARTILSGTAFQRLPPWRAWLLAVLAAWLVAVATVRLSTGWGVAATVALSGAVLGVAWAASAWAALLLPVAGPVLGVVVAFGGVSAYRQLTEESARRWATALAKQFVPPDHVEQISKHPELLRLGGERRDITVIFSDVAGFTPLSEKLEPEQLNQLLYHYLGAMTGVIYREHGTLDKYEGDGMMAFFGAPIPLDDHPLLAVRAALGMHAALRDVNALLRNMNLLPPDREIRIRVGCSTGPAMVGNFGAEQRFNYTAMGDTVNLGGRLEEANRWLGSRILVPETTRKACGEAVLFRPFGPALIRGKAEPVPLYEPLALEPAPDDLKALAEAYGRAIEAMNHGDLAAAEAALAKVLAISPEDAPSKVLAERIASIKTGQAGAADPWWNLARPK